MCVCVCVQGKIQDIDIRERGSFLLKHIECVSTPLRGVWGHVPPLQFFYNNTTLNSFQKQVSYYYSYKYLVTNIMHSIILKTF